MAIKPGRGLACAYPVDFSLGQPFSGSFLALFTSPFDYVVIAATVGT